MYRVSLVGRIVKGEWDTESRGDYDYQHVNKNDRGITFKWELCFIKVTQKNNNVEHHVMEQ